MKNYTYKLAGVTFEGRQETLKRLFEEAFNAEEITRKFMFNVKIEGTEFEGEPAARVYINDQEVGWIQKDKATDALEIAQKSTQCRVKFTADAIDLEDLEEIPEEATYNAILTFGVPEQEDIERMEEQKARAQQERAKAEKKEERNVKTYKVAFILFFIVAALWAVLGIALGVGYFIPAAIFLVIGIFCKRGYNKKHIEKNK